MRENLRGFLRKNKKERGNKKKFHVLFSFFLAFDLKRRIQNFDLKRREIEIRFENQKETW